MNDSQEVLTSDIVRMLVTSVTDSGKKSMSELEAERLLNAISRAQSGVPTGVPTPNGQNAPH